MAEGEKQKAESRRQKAARNCFLPSAFCLPPSAIRPLVIGHRGAAAVAPENTLVSFERALMDGADGIEFDVRLASDGQPVVIHDATLRRTVLRKGRVADYSSAELSAMSAGAWFNSRRPSLARAEYFEANIPTLRNIFSALGGRDALLYVEMKCGPQDRTQLASAVVKLIQAFQVKGRVVVESFDLPSITELKRIDSGVRTAALFDRKLSRPAPTARRMIELATECGAEELALHRSLATRRTVEQAARRGLEVVVWTVDSPAWVGRAIKNGVHALITNNPARLCARRAAMLDG